MGLTINHQGNLLTYMHVQMTTINLKKEEKKNV